MAPSLPGPGRNALGIITDLTHKKKKILSWLKLTDFSSNSYHLALKVGSLFFLLFSKRIQECTTYLTYILHFLPMPITQRNKIEAPSLNGSEIRTIPTA